MNEYRYFVFFRFTLAENNFADIVVVIDRFKTERAGKIEKIFQRAENAVAERFVFRRFALNGRERNESFQTLFHFFKIIHREIAPYYPKRKSKFKNFRNSLDFIIHFFLFMVK